MSGQAITRMRQTISMVVLWYWVTAIAKGVIESVMCIILDLNFTVVRVRCFCSVPLPPYQRCNIPET